MTKKLPVDIEISSLAKEIDGNHTLAKGILSELSVKDARRVVMLTYKGNLMFKGPWKLRNIHKTPKKKLLEIFQEPESALQSASKEIYVANYENQTFTVDSKTAKQMLNDPENVYWTDSICLINVNLSLEYSVSETSDGTRKVIEIPLEALEDDVLGEHEHIMT